MKGLLALAAGALLALPVAAQSAFDRCAKARDPVRCEALQAALKNCAAKRGAEKRACVEASVPPVDCAKTQDPQRCEAIRKAREFCQGRSGKELKKCLREEEPKQKRRKRPAET